MKANTMDDFDMLRHLNTEEGRFKAMCANVGRYPTTTFWTDFTIAEMFGEKAVRDTYKRAVGEWQHNPEYMGELTLVLNWKIWDFYEKDITLANLYNELWTKVENLCYDKFEGKDAERYFQITD